LNEAKTGANREEIKTDDMEVRMKNTNEDEDTQEGGIHRQTTSGLNESKTGAKCEEIETDDMEMCRKNTKEFLLAHPSCKEILF
jgi:hypothetical protein